MKKAIQLFCSGDFANAEILIKEELDRRSRDIVREGTSFIADSIFESDDGDDDDDDGEESEEYEEGYSDGYEDGFDDGSDDSKES